MAKTDSISKFQGIAPLFGNNLPKGMAVTAQNVDLSNGKIEILPTARRTVPTNLHTHTSMYWPIGIITSFYITLVAGVLKKTVSAILADLGHNPPAVPVRALNGAGVLTGDYYYFITTTRYVGGHADESGPSPSTVAITCAANKVLVTRPALTEALVTHWNIYRNDPGSSEYLFVATLAAATATYDDNIASADLGDACPSEYTSDQGNLITWAKPPTGIQGIANKPHSGIIFAWKNGRLYWNDTGLPDAFPALFYMDFPATIKRVFPFAGSVAVLTDKGPYRLDGTNPELLQPSDVLGHEPCVATAAYPTNKGILYLSDSGIVKFNMIDTPVMTDDKFGEDWFTANVSPTGAEIIENDGFIYLSHTGGILLCDTRRARNYIYTTLPLVAETTWSWRSGDLTGSSDLNQFTMVEVIGTGAVTVTVYLDGVLIATKALDLDGMVRDRMVKLKPEYFGRALQVGFAGGETDKVTEVFWSWV